MPAPSTSTLAPRGAAPSVGTPAKVDSAASPRLVMAWYITALPAPRPMRRSSCRRVSTLPPLPDCMAPPRGESDDARRRYAHWVSGNKNGRLAAPVSCSLAAGSVAVVVRLVGAVLRHAEVGRLVVGQRGELHADLLQVQARDF